MERAFNYSLIYYVFGFSSSLVVGFIFGFSDSHTPPLPFLIETVILLSGVIWLMIDGFIFVFKRQRSKNKFLIHLGGLIANASLLLFIVIKNQ